MTSPTRPPTASARVRRPSTALPPAPRRPATALPPAAQAIQGVRAGLVSRVLAGAVDAVATLLLLCGAYVGLVGLRYLLSPRTFTFPSPTSVLALSVLLGVQVLYLTGCWATTGRTYGDYVMGLRVVNRHGRRLHLVAALVRALTCALFPIGLFWVAVSNHNRSLQDLLLRTSVVYDWRA